MRTLKLSIIIFLGVTLLLTIIGFSMVLPSDTAAHPEYGFTPIPPPPPPPGGGGGGGDTGGGGGDSLPPTVPIDYVLVRLDQCNMVCYESYATADTDQAGPLLASVGSDVPFALFSPPASDAAPYEIIVPVRLVHEGSGWITEGALSTRADTQISVPYPGQWEIWLIGQPQFVTSQAVDATGTNLAQLQADVINAPVSLGTVEANSSDAQLIECPILCVVEPPETPAYLPETGTASVLARPTMWIAIFTSVSLLAMAIIRLKTAKE